MDAALAAKLLLGLQIFVEAEKVLGNANPIFNKMREMSAGGASFESILETVRTMVVGSEGNAQAAIDKMPADG